MHTKYKKYRENQIISYSGKHYQFLSTLHLAVTCSHDLSVRALFSAGAQYLSLDLCLWMASQSNPVGATGTWELAQHFPELESPKSSQARMWHSEVWVPSLQSTHSALPEVLCGIWHWNQSGFDSLGFVVAGLWSYATFSLFTIGIGDSYITIRRKEKYFVGKQWFKCLRDKPSIDTHRQASNSEWSLLD